MTLTVERLRELLRYDSDTGEFTWLNERNGRVRVGDLAGGLCSNRLGGLYRRIRIDGKKQKAHRLAYLYMTGSFPEGQVDHIDGDGLNNSWCNLRLASHAQQQHNKGIYANNSSGFKGVSFHKRKRKWSGGIRFQGRRIHLGDFETAEEAHKAYVAAAAKYHGEFARIK